MSKSTPVKGKIKDAYALQKPDNCSPQRLISLNQCEPVEVKLSAYNTEAIRLFRDLKPESIVLPPAGYHWVQSASKRVSMVKKKTAPDHELETVIYGPEDGKINFLFLQDGVTQSVFSHTKKVRDKDREPIPVTDADYRVKGFNYKKKGDSSLHMRGHCIDDADTMRTGGRRFWSTLDSRNIIPEPPYKYWGTQMRRLAVREYRKEGHGYAQLFHYPDNPLKTSDGTPVPDSSYFNKVEIDPSKPYSTRYTMSDTLHIDWAINYKKKKPKGQKVLEYSKNYETKAAPAVKLWDVNESDRRRRRALSDANKRLLAIQSGKITSVYPDRDSVYASRFISDGEFESVHYGLDAAIWASKQNEGGNALFELKSSLSLGESFWEAGLASNGHRKVLSKNQVASVVGLFKEKAPGFEDPDGDMLDRLNQLSANFELD